LKHIFESRKAVNYETAFLERRYSKNSQEQKISFSPLVMAIREIGLRASQSCPPDAASSQESGSPEIRQMLRANNMQYTFV
jgi:hypothetical protein